MELQTTLIREMKKLRTALLDSTAQARSHAMVKIFREALNDSLFPLTFLVRNVMSLQKEARWRTMPGPERRSALLRVVQERCCIFNEVKVWLHLKGKLPQPDAEFFAGVHNGYCTHCGGCCEIASGLEDFPEKSEIPCSWRRLFGTGLGANHRFCPFLWELNGKALSLCAIHQWRPRPCRLFAEQECRNLMQDRDFTTLLDRSRLAETCRKVTHLINSRQSPSRSEAGMQKRRPEFEA